MLLSIVIVLVLVVLNGFFAMSELAIVSARRPRLETMAKAGSRGAARAMKLAEDPTLRRRPLAIGSASAIVTMVACGLWHGNTPALAVWGLGHGVAIAAHQLYRQRLLAELPARRRKALTQHPAYRAAATSLTFASIPQMKPFVSDH